MTRRASLSRRAMLCDGYPVGRAARSSATAFRTGLRSISLDEGHKAQLVKYGASEDFAQGLLDVHAEKDRGLDMSEPRTPENTTPTTFREWCTTVLKPALDFSDGDGGRR